MPHLPSASNQQLLISRGQPPKSKAHRSLFTLSFAPPPPRITVDSRVYMPAELVTLMVFVPSNFIKRLSQVSFKMALQSFASIVALSRVRVMVLGSKYTLPLTPEILERSR